MQRPEDITNKLPKKKQKQESNRKKTIESGKKNLRDIREKCRWTSIDNTLGSMAITISGMQNTKPNMKKKTVEPACWQWMKATISFELNVSTSTTSTASLFWMQMVLLNALSADLLLELEHESLNDRYDLLYTILSISNIYL